MDFHLSVPQLAGQLSPLEMFILKEDLQISIQRLPGSKSHHPPYLIG